MDPFLQALVFLLRAGLLVLYSKLCKHLAKENWQCPLILAAIITYLAWANLGREVEYEEPFDPRSPREATTAEWVTPKLRRDNALYAGTIAFAIAGYWAWKKRTRPWLLEPAGQ